MFANMELVLWRDGGWIVYSMMLIAMLVLFLAGRCEGGKGVLGWIRTVWVMNSIGFLIVVFAFGFYLPFIASSGLSEFIEVRINTNPVRIPPNPQAQHLIQTLLPARSFRSCANGLLQQLLHEL
jgi:hypothetical protein